MNMQNACATLFKIKIGFRFQIWFWMRSSFISAVLQLWVKVKGSVGYYEEAHMAVATNDHDERLHNFQNSL